MALAGAMIAGACSSTGTTTLATDSPVAADGGTDDTTSTEFDPVDPEPAVDPTPAPTPAPTTTPGPLITPTPVPSPIPPRPVSTCPGTPVPAGPLFVWDVADDDADGGLVAHTDADVDSPITRVLAPNALAVRPTGNCKPAPNGAPWFELFDPASDQFDWVNARYLAPASPACLHGEAAGGATRTALAAGEADTQLFGPLPGIARAEGDLVAFIPNSDQLGGQAAPALTFRWFAADSITIDVPCFLEGATGPVCLSGTVLIFDFLDHSPRVNGDLPIEATRTGRLYARPAERGLRDEFVEVMLDGDPGRYWYDPATTRTGSAPCPVDGSAPVDEVGAATFDTLACTVGWEGTDAVELSSGSTSSTADHVRNLTTHIDETSGCVRFVIELGTNLWNDEEARAVNSLPPITASKAATSTLIAFDSCAPVSDCDIIGHSFDTSGSVTAASIGATAFVTQRGVQLLHPEATSNVTFRENPARIIVDLIAEPGASRQWYGTSMLIADRLPTNVSTDQTITVRGWGRPFEAQGQWRIYRIDDLEEPLDDVAPDALDLVDSGLMMTDGWTTAAGAFEVTLPPLEPGLYALLFGETPPGDDVAGYVAAGQVVRIYDPASDPASLPAIPEQVWDEIALVD